MIDHKKMRFITLTLMLVAGSLKATDLHAEVIEQASLTNQYGSETENCCCLCHKKEALYYNPATCPCHQAPKRLTRKELAIRVALFGAGVALITCAGLLGYYYARKIFIARMTQWIDDEVNNATQDSLIAPELKQVIRFLYDTGCLAQKITRYLADEITLERSLHHFNQALDPF